MKDWFMQGRKEFKKGGRKEGGTEEGRKEVYIAIIKIFAMAAMPA